jgi:hypothetical protein
MGETIMLAFTDGHLAGQSFLLRGLPRGNLLLTDRARPGADGRRVACRAPEAGE